MRHLAVALSLALGAAGGARPPDAVVRRLIESAKFKQATAFIESDYDRFIRELIALTEIPAPPFKEQQRGRVFQEMLRRHGLSHVEADAEGNVMGVRAGGGRSAMYE
jgi:hypothetical protein